MDSLLLISFLIFCKLVCLQDLLYGSKFWRFLSLRCTFVHLLLLGEMANGWSTNYWLLYFLSYRLMLCTLRHLFPNFETSLHSTGSWSARLLIRSLVLFTRDPGSRKRDSGCRSVLVRCSNKLDLFLMSLRLSQWRFVLLPSLIRRVFRLLISSSSRRNVRLSWRFGCSNCWALWWDWGFAIDTALFFINEEIIDPIHVQLFRSLKLFALWRCSTSQQIWIVFEGNQTI